MGSNKGHGEGRDRRGRNTSSRAGRRGEPNGRRRSAPVLESLEERRLLSTFDQPPTWMPTSNNPLDVQHGPLARAGNTLVQVYQEYQQFKTNAQPGPNGQVQVDPSQFVSSNKELLVKDGMVMVDVAVFGDVPTASQTVAGSSIGMQVTATSPQFHMIEGYVPIDNLVNLANLKTTYNGQQVPMIYGITPVIKPQVNSQGSAPNQAETGLGVTQALQQYPGINGSGVTVGVISTSANRYQGGLQDSINSGDLPALGRINVLQDAPANAANPEADSDEGRAMMEEIYDLAPGANLAFNTGMLGPVAMANGVTALAKTAGAQVIVDDIGYATDPEYQVGAIEQAIQSVVQKDNVIYFSAAGNSANKGFESPFRSGSGTVAGTSGTYMNFNPSGNSLTLPITINYPNGYLFLQYDQPVNGVSSNVDLILLDSNGNQVNTTASGRGGLDINPATGQPMEAIALSGLTPGQYSVAVRVTSGPAPGRIDMYEFGSDIDFSKKYGNSGGITYPTSIGHNAGVSTIGVGAVDYKNTPGFNPPSPIPNEDYSSYGPRVLEFDVNGNRLAGGPQVLQRPQVSGIDDVDTSFFIPGQDTNGDGHPNFTGTSAAAPNLAAVAALMRQLSPGVSSSAVVTAMENSAIPLNGAPAGLWNPQGGYGLVQATASMQAVDQLRVLSTTPSNNATLTTSTSTITVNFNKPLDPTTVQASDLQFTQVPAGVTVNVTLQSVSGSTAVFGISFVHGANTTANGTYAFKLANGAMASTDGKTLAGYSSSFTLNDTIAPRIVSTSFSNRTVTVHFSEAMDPSTINKYNLFLVRTGSSGQFNNPSNVILITSSVVVNYDPKTFTATIDLSALPQSMLPTDHYALVVLDSLTDLVGNKLDGEFGYRQLNNGQILGAGVFPSGNGKAGGTFDQDLGVITLQPPHVLYVKLAPKSDSGIKGDQTTQVRQPTFVGQVTESFPGAIAGLQVVAQFNGLHDGTFDLTQGTNGRGYNANASIDVSAVTDANGKFHFTVPSALADGFYTVRVVVVGAPDQPPLPGFSSVFDQSFRIDTTTPTLTTDPASVQQNAYLSNLTNNGITLDAIDYVNPQQLGDPFAVPLQYQNSALDPATATNISNYTLLDIGTDQNYNPANASTYMDESSYIANITYTDTTSRSQTNSPLTGQVHFAFNPGLPNGRYLLIAHTTAPGYQGVKDAAGNFLDGNYAMAGLQNYELYFNFRSTPAYVVNAQNISPDGTATGPKAFFEVPQPGTSQDAPIPPNSFVLDFSSTLNLTANYNGKVMLIGSADSTGAFPDGNFGTDPTFTSGVGYHVVQGTTVTLENSVLGAQPGQPGFKNRLVVSLPKGRTLAPDHYRLYMPNMIMPDGTDLRVFDIYGNQVDGEFQGAQASNGSYQDLMPNGSLRAGLSGDGTPGGSFEYGIMVVPNGNVIYAKPDYVDDPFLTADDANGTAAHPYPVLAPQALPDALNGGDLNSAVNFGTGFNPNADVAGRNQFERSAFYAASILSQKGPVVILAEPASPNDPQHRTFVLQKPNVVDPGKPSLPDGSASVPNNTTLVFEPGSILKMYDASLFVQRQGTGIQFLGGPNPTQQAIVTSYLDDSVGGDTNGDGAPTTQGGTGAAPQPGDFGGIVLRNFDDTSYARPIPIAPGPDDPNRADLYQNAGLSQNLGLSGADDSMSFFNNMSIRYAGGAVPQTIGYRFDAITMFNSRPTITNVSIDGRMPPGLNPGPNGGSQAGISVDMDSLREDPLTRGPLIRNDTVSNTSLNGIYVRAELDGAIEPTNAVFYTNYVNGVPQQSTPTSVVPLTYSFNDPLPYLMITRMVVGEALLHNSGLNTDRNVTDNVLVNQGMMLKFNRGAGIDQITPGSIMNLGDRNYFDAYQAFKQKYPNQNFGPYYIDPNTNQSVPNPYYKAPSTGDARVLLTSLYDATATTQYVNPNTGVATTIVPAINSANSPNATNQPTPTNVPPLARWGSIAVQSGARIIMNEATVEYGGGTVNENNGTIPQRDVLAFQGAGGIQQFGQTFGQALGTAAYISSNNFQYNLQAAISDTPDGLLAADPLTPLDSGNPFFRGNVFQGNDVNGLEVFGGELTVDSVWDDTDLPHILRGTIYMAGAMPTGLVSATPIRPSNVITLQSAVSGTTLADGSQIPKPGESLLVKLYGTAPLGDGILGQPTGNIQSSYQAGAGFLAGYDNGVDPPSDLLLDPGAFSQIRIVGIGGNETTGQQRVPVIITSARDNSVGKTVRGVTMNAAIPALTGTPQPGDGGMIGFGGLTLSDYNLYNPMDGNIIDNADIKYLTRIDIQGGGWVYNGNDPTTTTLVGGGYQAKIGNNKELKFNTAKSMTISNSVLQDFSQAGVVAHPSYANQLDVAVYPVRDANGNIVDYQLTQFIGRNTGNLRGQGVVLFMVNNVLANMPIGVSLHGDVGSVVATPTTGILLNNTFYNTAEGVHAEGPTANPGDTTYLMAMNNIFADNTTDGVTVIGGSPNSQLEYNLYSNTPTQVNIGQAIGIAAPFNAQAIAGNAALSAPANGNFSLTATSDAIDAALSELKQNPAGNLLKPLSIPTAVLNSGTRLPNTLPVGTVTTSGLSTAGRTDPFGGNYNAQPGDILTQPGYPPNLRGFNDQWVPALPATSGSPYFTYTSINGERDIAGFLRQDDPNKATVGSGSRPFFDIGAYEYRQLFPPDVTKVQVVLKDNATGSLTTQNLYQPGGIGGTNQSPQQILITFNQKLDQATLNSLTVLLQSSGGDGIFGNSNNSQDKYISLSGKLAYDPKTSTLTINLGSLSLPTDLYRITLLGSGGDVIRNPQGLALDGENTVGGKANGTQLALPSGDGNPGGNFYTTFSIDTHPPAIVDGTFQLQADGDNYPDDRITSNPQPTFIGTITDTPPPSNPVAGQTVHIDISTKGDGNYDIKNAGVGTTDAQGNFSVTLTKPLPNSTVNVGPDGILGTADDVLSSYSQARVRIVDQAGNVSNLNDPNATYRFDEDHKAPSITAQTPKDGSNVNPVNNQVTVTLSVDENIDPKTLTSGNFTVVRSGGDGTFNDGNEVQMLVNPSSIQEQYLGTPNGAAIIRFTIAGVSVNDVYQVTVNGGAGGLADLAGNTLQGGNDVFRFVVLNPAYSHNIFVGPNSAASGGTTTPDGSRNNPYPTIAQGLAAANIGDTVAVLAGSGSANVYTESVTMKSLLHLVSAAPSSTDSNVVPGNPLRTVIRAPFNAGQATTTIDASNLYSNAAFLTEISGFTIASPLSTGGATGSIVAGSTGIQAVNTDMQIDRNYLIDNGVGVNVQYTAADRPGPLIMENGIIGNIYGVKITDNGPSGFAIGRPTLFANNTVAFNTHGLYLTTTGNVPEDASVVNNIFWENVSKTAPLTGEAMYASTPGKISVGNNLFSANGPSVSSPADDTVNIGGAFNPSVLNPNFFDPHGNITGNPAFVQPIDPRPEGNGPGSFFVSANYDLTGSSAAIDNAINAVALSTDFLHRGRVDIPNRGYAGPADMGAFEYNGSGGITSAVSTMASGSTTVSPSIQTSATGVASASATPSSVRVSFANPIDHASVQATDLLLSGDGLDPSNPAHATSLNWVDNQTVQFNLSGSFRSSGSVLIDIPAGAIQSSSNQALPEFSTQIASPLAGTTSNPATPTPSNGGGTSVTTSTPVSSAPAPMTSAPVIVTSPTPFVVTTPTPSLTPTPNLTNPRAARLAALRQARLAAQQARFARQAQVHAPRAGAAAHQSGFLARLARFGRRG